MRFLPSWPRADANGRARHSPLASVSTCLSLICPKAPTRTCGTSGTVAFFCVFLGRALLAARPLTLRLNDSETGRADFRGQG